jgi:MFS family permease
MTISGIRMPTGKLLAAIVAGCTCDFALGLTLQLVPLLMDRDGWSAWAIGVNIAMGPIGILIFGPFLPRLLVKAGLKPSALFLIATLALSLAAMSVSPLWMWFPLYCVFSVATISLFTVSEAWVLSFAARENRGRLMGVYTSLLSISFAIGPLILPWTGMEGMLPWAVAIVCISLSAVPLTLARIDDEDFRRKGSGSFFRFFTKAPMLLFAIAAATLFENVLVSFFTIYGMRNGLDLNAASLMLGIGIIGNVLMFYPLGWMSDRWSRQGVMLLTAVITIILSLSLLAVIGHWIAWPVMVLLIGMAFGVNVVALATMGDSFSGADLVAGAAASGTMWGAGGLVGPPLAGLAIDLFGIDAMPVTLALFYVLLLAGLLATGGQLVRRPVNPQEAGSPAAVPLTFTAAPAGQ